MEYGAHLPLIDLGGAPPTLAGLHAFARAAGELGYTHLCANDHLIFARPWLDGPTALAATIDDAPELVLATTVCLPVLRGPVPMAKTLAALDVLSGGRVVAGVGPGSSARDYEITGVPFEERWPRFDEAIEALRSLLHRSGEAFTGRYYTTEGLVLEPPPARPDGMPIWVASWGSPAGLRRVARLGDGWLASAYNTTPERFRDGLSRLAELRAGTPPLTNGIATAWLLVTDDPREAERALADVLAPMLRRSVEALRELALPIGPPEACAERLRAFRAAGAERVFVWPLADPVRQLGRFRAEVVPLVEA